ncbi:histamine H2 receptor-like [Dendronephthya gigantea]|uniref:histamine H2 receptor-like n=1 Tax=Dendronephthya gigantea TaxID=151771 RepID=UPI00106D0472|nr:histamine H2 receptor-like [Dendronephthya gigantea]
MDTENVTYSLQSYLTGNERTILTGLFAVLSIFGLFGNGIVVYVVISLRHYLDVPANIFILSQAFTDFGTALSLLIYIVHMYVWIWDVFFWYTAVVWLASLGSLFLLTLNRLLSVIDPFAYPRRMTATRARGLVVLNWMLALVVTVYPLLIPGGSLDTSLGRYYIVITTTCVILFNLYLFREGRIQSRKIKRQSQIVTGLQKYFKEDFKSVRTQAMVGGTFLVCCLPITVVVFIYGDDQTSREFQRYAAFTGMLMPINAILDPVIYYFRSREFRAFYLKFKRSWQSNDANFSKSFNPPKSLQRVCRVKPAKIEVTE